MSKEKVLQSITVNGETINEIDESIDVDGRKFNVRLIEDFKDGRLKVEHSVFHNKTFLGNVTTILYRSNPDGIKQLIADLGTGKASRIIYDRNRQALSDSKNEFRGDQTRESKVKPETKVSKQIAANIDFSKLTSEQIKAFQTLGVDISTIKLTK